MIGTIQQAKRSTSGLTLSVQINNKWYTTKNWEFEKEIGRTVIFEPSISPASGNFPEMHWLNDYVFEDAATTPSAQAMNAALAQASAVPPDVAAGQVGGAGRGLTHSAELVARQEVPRGTPNMDAVLGAGALIKAFRGNPEEIWAAWQYFYHEIDKWDPNNPY